MELAKYAGMKIKEYRKKKNITQTELAKKLNIGKSAVSNYEAGYRMPKQDLLFKLSNIFDEPVDSFFPRNNLDPPQQLLPLDKKIGEKIKKIRKSKGLSQQTLAYLMQISLHDLLEYESGKKPFTIQVVFKFTITLGVTFDDIFPEDLKYNQIPNIFNFDEEHRIVELDNGDIYKLNEEETIKTKNFLTFVNRQ